MKGKNPVVGRYQNGSFVALRATPGEKAEIREQAALAGMNVSNFIRLKFFGGRPIVANVPLAKCSNAWASLYRVSMRKKRRHTPAP